jgi:tetratricopeptide (TPR) repeat protein
MRCRIHFLFLSLLLIGSVLTGCAPQSIMPYTAEVDDPEYRRGKELQRLGRNPEALASFLKVIETRGGAAAESHLDAGILYQEHIRDPIAAIYHYRKFRELRPNAKQADLVLQRIDAATREFARTLPAQPLDNQVDRTDMMDAIDKLQRENLQLKEQLVAARAATLDSTRQPLAPLASDPAGAATGTFDFGMNATGTDGPPARTPDGPAPIGVVPIPSPSPAPLSFATEPAAPQPAIVATPPPTAPAAVTSAAARRHTVAKGDTLYSLAQRYYSNRSRWREIYAANRETMRSETDMRIGMELKIPQ